jgi:hypothetical protein
MRNGAFVLRQAGETAYYSCRALEELPNLCHGFSTRRGGTPDAAGSSLNLGYVSWDPPERVDANRRRFLRALRLMEAHLAVLRQVHSNRVHIIKDRPAEWNPPEGDALICRLPGIALAVQVADCLPVLIADPATRAIAAVHAGWRGTLARVLREAVREMQRTFGADPSNLLVAVGPGIRACCCEVGPEVAELFEKEFPGCRLSRPAAAPGKYLLDLGGALERDLDDSGVAPQHRHDLGLCTRCNPQEFFSYRAEGERSGRMMAVIGRLSP